MAEPLYDVEVPFRFVGPIGLKDGRLLGFNWPLKIMHSADGGRTWQDEGPMINRDGTEFIGKDPVIKNVIRMASGAIAVAYWEEAPQKTGSGTLQSFFRKSLDDGKTWSDPVQVTWPNTPTVTTFLMQMSSGRLILPNAYAYSQDGKKFRHNAMQISTVFYSDDEGETWGESADSVFVGEEDHGARATSVEEPTIAETADGRLLMFMRTEVQRIAQSYSADGGEHWEQGVLNSLVSSLAAVWLTRIPTTGDLLCVWNQSSAEETATGYYRSRLSSAISRDSGATWENFRTMVSAPGVKEIDQITDPDPPGFLMSSGVLPELGQILPEGHRTVRHPRLRFIDDIAYLTYDDRWYDQQGQKTSMTWQLRALPVSWFYEG